MSAETNTKAIAGAIAAIVVLVGAAVWFDQSKYAPWAPLVAVAPDETTEEAANEPAEVAEAVEPLEPESIAVPGPAAPRFDTFFRNPDDTTIVAGRATPGQTVAIMLGGAELERVVTSLDGTFGALVMIAGSDQPRRLTLIGDPDGDAIASTDSILVPPSAAVALAAVDPKPDTLPVTSVAQTPEVAVVVQDATDDVAQIDLAAADDVLEIAAPEQTAAVVSDIADVAQDEPVIAASTAGAVPPPDPVIASDPDAVSSALSLPTLVADADGVRVIQPAPSDLEQPVFTDNVALDTITYDTTGEVFLAGRAVAGGFVQIYLDNKPVTTSPISDTGGWKIDLPDVDTGVYTLRVDEVDADGNVQSRVETPFKREEAADVAAILAEETSADGFDIAVKTVQPGATLWAIAEETFGNGIMYVAVFDANRDLIRDPDLIYPGQVFRLPETIE